MPQRDSSDIRRRPLSARKLLIAAFGAAALTVGLLGAGASAVRAAEKGGDNGSEDEPLTVKLMRTLGLRDPAALGEGIDYSERSPLVVPPTRNLPPPVSSNTPPTPNWPKDPDIQRRARAKAEEKATRTYDYVVESNRPLRPDELNVPGPDRNAPIATNSPNDTTPAGEKKSSFFSFDWAKKQQFATFTGEPSRDTLTDPPPGYRTPSADQPYGLGQEKAKYEIPTLSDRMEVQR